MKRLLLVLALGCAPDVDLFRDHGGDAGLEPVGQATQALGAEPLTFGLYGGTPDSLQPLGRGKLWQALELAMDRWADATCLPLDFSVDPAHKVRWALPGESWPNSSLLALTFGAEPNQKIKVRETMTDDTALVDTLTHEMCHVLSNNNNHAGPANSICQTPAIPGRLIYTADIVRVCADRDCACSSPEG